MPLFFLLSGFSLTVGYGDRILQQSPSKYHVDTDTNVADAETGEDAATTMSVAPEYDEKEHQRGSLGALSIGYWKFLFFRALRVMPVYYITLFLVLPAVFAGYGDLDPSHLTYLYESIITNVIPVNTWFSFLLGAPLNGPSWTICTLWMFWLCFPSLVRNYDKKTDLQLLSAIVWMFYIQIAVMALLLAICIFSGLGVVAFFAATMWPPGRLPIFVMGIAAGLLVRRHPKIDGATAMPWFSDSNSYLPCVCFCCCCCRASGPKQSNEVVFSQSVYVQSLWLLGMTSTVVLLDTVLRYMVGVDGGIGGGIWLQALNPFSQLCLIVGVTRSNAIGVVSLVLRHKWSQWLGKRSMAIYLCHFIFLFYLRWALAGKKTLSWPSEFDCNTYDEGSSKRQDCRHEVDEYNAGHELPNWAVFVILPASILFANLLFNIVEEPTRKYFRG